jgi:hypothetical protein
MTLRRWWGGFVSAVQRGSVHEIGILGLLVMEIAMIVPWFRSLTVPTSALTTAAALGLLLGAAFTAMILARAARSLRWRGPALLLALLGALLLSLRLVIYRGIPVGILELILRSFGSFATILTLVPAELVVLLAVIYAWRRGVLAASDPALDPGRTAYRMRVGILTGVVYGVVYGEGGSGRLLEILPLYFAAGVTAVAMSRADGLRRFRGASRSPFTWQWQAAVLGLVLGTVALGVLAASALSSAPTMRAAQGAVRWILEGAQVLLVAIGPLIVWIATLIERAVEWAGQAVHLQPVFLRVREAIPEIPRPTPVARAPESWLEPYGPSLQILGTALGVLLLTLLAIRIRRILMPGGRLGEDRSERLPVHLPHAPDLRGILARVGANLEGVRRFGRRFFAAAVIRRIYAQLLSLAESRGRRREPAQTPREFMPELWAVFPHHREDVKLITEEYLKVRYGEYPEEDATVAGVRAAWARLVGEARRGARA